MKGSVSAEVRTTFAADDQQARRVRLPLLGKGAVSAHPFEHPLAAQMDETEQSPGARRARVAAAAFRPCGRLRPLASDRPLSYDGQGYALSLLLATEQQSRRARSEHPLAVEIDACRRMALGVRGWWVGHGLL